MSSAISQRPFSLVQRTMYFPLSVAGIGGACGPALNVDVHVPVSRTSGPLANTESVWSWIFQAPILNISPNSRPIASRPTEVGVPAPIMRALLAYTRTSESARPAAMAAIHCLLAARMAVRAAAASAVMRAAARWGLSPVTQAENVSKPIGSRRMVRTGRLLVEVSLPRHRRGDVRFPDVLGHQPPSALIHPPHDVLARIGGRHAGRPFGAGAPRELPASQLDGHRPARPNRLGANGEHGGRAGHGVQHGEERADRVAPVHRRHVRGEDHRIRLVVLGERVRMTCGGKTRP